MRRLSLFIACTLAWGMAKATPPQVHDLATGFARFWERTQDMPPAERVALFKRDVASAFPDFYGVQRYGGKRTDAEQDARIERALREFPAIRDDFQHKANGAARQLARHAATLRQAFSDFRLPQQVYLVHSLGEMDAGPRTLNGRDYLVFGVDLMAKLHGRNDESAFYQHELFHTWHLQLLGECDSGQVWSSLWKEGLATYVSQVLNPQANERELLLDYPAGMPARTRAMLPAAWRQLDEVLASSEASAWGGQFHTRTDDGTGLPGRRGYYLGYLVAEAAAKQHSLQALATRDCAASRELVRSTVQALGRQALDGAAPPRQQ